MNVTLTPAQARKLAASADPDLARRATEALSRSAPDLQGSCAFCGRLVSLGTDGDWYDNSERSSAECYRSDSGHVVRPDDIGVVPKRDDGFVRVQLVSLAGVLWEQTMPATPGSNWSEWFTPGLEPTVTEIRVVVV
jgi:hypothetical protein